jgi:hypothetical protein
MENQGAKSEDVDGQDENCFRFSASEGVGLLFEKRP